MCQAELPPCTVSLCRSLGTGWRAVPAQLWEVLSTGIGEPPGPIQAHPVSLLCSGLRWAASSLHDPESSGLCQPDVPRQEEAEPFILRLRVFCLGHKNHFSLLGELFSITIMPLLQTLQMSGNLGLLVYLSACWGRSSLRLWISQDP